MNQRYHTIVLGMGGMGSAAIYHLAQRGERVLGLEQFDIPHDFGSSHGHTRIIRTAYFEQPSYVPLLRRSYELWRELQVQAREQLLYMTGGVNVGPADGEVFQGAFLACEEHDLPREVLTASDLMARYPAYRLPPDYMAVVEPDAGFLVPERCIVAHITGAQALGADVFARTKLLSWEPLADGVRVETDRGVFEADRLIVSAGAWASKHAPELRALAVPERQVLAWFQPHAPELFQPKRFPVWIVETHEGMYYGFPIFGVPGFKLGRFRHLRKQVDPDTIDRPPAPRDEALLRAFTERYFPQAAGPTMALKACMFTNSPDGHFIIDRLPAHPQVIIAAGFSGHGFKFASVVGEILADLATRDATDHDIAMFRLSRFTASENREIR